MKTFQKLAILALANLPLTSFAQNLCAKLIQGKKSAGTVCLHKSDNTGLQYLSLESPQITATKSATLSPYIAVTSPSMPPMPKNDEMIILDERVLRVAGWLETHKNGKVSEGLAELDLNSRLQVSCSKGQKQQYCIYSVSGILVVRSSIQRPVKFEVSFSSFDKAAIYELIEGINQGNPIVGEPVEVSQK